MAKMAGKNARYLQQLIAFALRSSLVEHHTLG
jgi:hypothetical protein